MPKPKKVTVYYWGPNGGANMYGRGIGIYLTLDEAGMKYEMKGQADMPEGTAMAMPAVDIDGVCMGQTPAVLAVLGERLGLAGKTPTEKMRCLQAMEDMNDVFGEHGKWADDAARKDKWFAYLEKKLEVGGKKWLAGTDKPTIADFHGVFAFEWVVKKGIDFSKYPLMTKWWEEIKQYPVVAKMYASCVDGRTMIPQH